MRGGGEIERVRDGKGERKRQSERGKGSEREILGLGFCKVLF